MHQTVSPPVLTSSAPAGNSKLESRRLRYACYFALAVVLAFFAIIRFHLRNMPLERDEGEYAYMGQLILHGVPPYKLASNMKLPGTYLAYAGMMELFGDTTAGIHLGMILVTTLSALLLFLLGKRLYGTFCGTIAAISYIFLCARPAVLGIDGHATHFVVLFALAGILLLLYAIDAASISVFFLTGLAFGLSFLMKQPGILFAIFAGFYLLWYDWKHDGLGKQFFLPAGALVLGTLIPYIAICLWLWRAGVFADFWFWTWTYAKAYGEINSLHDGWRFLGFTFKWAVRPFVLWEIVLVGLSAPFWSRTARAHSGFVTSFFLMSALAVCPGLYFRPHYYIVLLPAAALCIGIAVDCAQRELRSVGRGRYAFLPVLYFAVMYIVSVHGQYRAFFRLDPVSLSRKIHYDQPYADAANLASYIGAHAAPGDQIGIIGSEPEVCFYTRLRCTSSYLYVFPLMEKQPYARQMQADFKHQIETARPRWVIYVDDERSWGWKPTLDENRPFLDWGWNFAHHGYALVEQLPAPDIGAYPEHLFGDAATLYLFERDPR